jgi:two-component system chemotaxis response regulator CheB
MRKAVVSMLESDPKIEVVGTASNGKEGVELAKRLCPSVITLDIEMPEMDGLTALKKIMRECPTHVIMLSSLTTKGSEASFTALKLGAADVLAKEQSKISLNITQIQNELVYKVKALSATPYKPRGIAGVVRAPAAKRQPGSPIAVRFEPDQFSLICIGSSTGGPPILESIITALPKKFDIPIVIAQHMPEIFTASLADRLTRIASRTVLHVETGMTIERNKIYIARGGHNMHITQPRLGVKGLLVNDKPEDAVYKPSVNALFSSASKFVGRRCLGIVLTGIGDDGLKGSTELNAAGGVIIAQDAETSVVYGMPRAVTEAGIARASLTPPQISESLSSLVSPELRRAG